MNKLIFLILSIGLLWGCSQSTPVDNSNLTKKIEELEREIVQLKSDLAFLQSTVESDFLRAPVSTTEEGYSVAKTKFGAFSISSKGVTPYLDGYKVKISIGNITNATFDGIGLNVAWGKGKDRKEKDFDLTDRLFPGANSTVEVNLTPAKPEDIKLIWVGLKLDKMWLRR